MDEHPRVSILMPIRDGLPHLITAVDSIRKQLFENFELIAIDDGCQDGSRPLLQSLSREDARIRIFDGSGTGLVDALNLGLAQCRAPLVARMDADDLSHPDRIGMQVSAMDANVQLIVLGSAIHMIDANGNNLGHRSYPVGSAAVRQALLMGPPVAHPSVMFRRDPVRDLGGYRAWFRHCEDYDLWLRCSRLGSGSIDNLPHTLLDYRIHPDSISQKHPLEQHERCEIAWWLHKLHLAGLTEPALLTEDDAVTVCERFPLSWRTCVRAGLLLQRTALVGGKARDRVQAHLLSLLFDGVSESPSSEVLVAFHLRAAGWELRRASLSATAREFIAAGMSSPSLALLGLIRRLAGIRTAHAHCWLEPRQHAGSEISEP